MPIAGWRCATCKQEVPLDHYQVTRCGLNMHPDFAAAVYLDRLSQESRKGVRVTNGLGCPRSNAIIAVENLFVDPATFNAQITGTAFHALMEGASVDSINSEVLVHGVIQGISLSGKIDRVRKIGEVLICEDFKHGNDFARKYAQLKPEYIVQVSIYAELYAQQFGERPAGGVIWRHFTGSPPFVPFTFKLWDVEQCLAHKPYGGMYTVGELYTQAASETAWQDLPLAGSSMNFGSKSFCDYCEVRTVCTEQATGAPF